MAAATPKKIRMVAGLGNPGDEYENTRHNAGFKSIDVLAAQAGVTYWKNQLAPWWRPSRCTIRRRKADAARSFWSNRSLS